MLLRRIIPKLGGAFPACIREDKIKIVAALDVALLRNALDDAVPFHLVRCGVMDFRKQMHSAHGDSSVRMFYDVFLLYQMDAGCANGNLAPRCP